MKKGNPEKRNGLIQNTSEEKRGNPEKHKGAQSKDSR
jgi:hypothetical protein